MINPVLKTKLNIPTLRPELVHRARLTETLQHGIRRRITLVSAPAGFGKTTLVGCWIRECGRTASWLSLEPGDSDPVRFLSYLIAAFQVFCPEEARVLRSEFQTLKPSSAEPVLTRLLNAVAEIQGRCVLVFDDYHLIHDNTVHGYLGFLADHLPEQLHLVICTRADPPLPLPMLRARGQLTELRAEDLRFDRQETTEFLTRLMGLDLALSDIEVLSDHTEGWIAGLQMAAVSLQGRRDTSSFIKSFTGSNRYILDYLIEEVLSRQPESIQEFLLKSSILDRLTGPLCDVVIGQAESQAILRQLERDNLFIVPLDSERQWYRYHTLFAELLLRRAEQSYPEQMDQLHRRASRWYESNGLITEAIDHTLAEGDYQRAMVLIEDNTQGTLMRSEFATVLRWIESLPSEMVCTRPLLCVYHAIGLLLAGAPMNQIQMRLDAAKLADTDGSIAGQLASFHAFLAAFQGDIDESVRQSNLALELLPAEEKFFRSAISRILVNITYASSGDVPSSIEMYEETIGKCRVLGNVTIAGALMAELGELRMIQGRLHQAGATYRQALEQTVDAAGNPTPVAGLAMMGMGNLLREWNDLEAAERHLQQGIELVGNLGAVGTLDGYLTLARVKMAQDRAAEANQVMETVHKIATRFDASELDDLIVDLNRARIWLMQGRVDAAERWYGEWTARRSGSTDKTPYLLTEMDQILKIRILLAAGRLEECQRVARRLEKNAGQLGRKGVVLEAQMLQSLAVAAGGGEEQALQILENVLRFAQPEGYLRIFLDEGTPMARLLYAAAERGMHKEYVGTLLSGFPLREDQQRALDASTGIVETLSPREVQVLHLLARGLSNKDLARELYISLPTVKWHTSNIYGKLGVQNRTEAVAKARALGLLAGS